MWGFDYNFTNYNLRKTLVFFLNISCQRGDIQAFFEIIAGELIVKSSYELKDFCHVGQYARSRACVHAFVFADVPHASDAFTR